MITISCNGIWRWWLRILLVSCRWETIVYIRSKKVKDIDYAYLVRSVWNPKLNIARQQMLRYYGKASDITLDKIPIEYRNNKKILYFLSAYALQSSTRKKISISRFHVETFKTLREIYKQSLPSTEIIARAMILQTSLRIYSNQLCIMSENCGNKIRLMHRQNTL